jgi:hypothetical protein
MEKGFNYARFFRLLKKLPGADKEALVGAYTNGRTGSLREMHRSEYDALCAAMEDITGIDMDGRARQAAYAELKRRRSTVLKLMQQLGINTADWSRVDSFCMEARIAGKLFRHISAEELEVLAVKLRSIARKGGLRTQGVAGSGSSRAETVYLLLPAEDKGN